MKNDNDFTNKFVLKARRILRRNVLRNQTTFDRLQKSIKKNVQQQMI